MGGKEALRSIGIAMQHRVVQRRTCWYGWILVLLTLVSGCVHIPMSSDIIINNKLKAIQPLERGEVLVVYGENATVPKQSIQDLFTAGCLASFHRNTIGNLITTILKMNPNPGRFAVRDLKDLEKEGGPDCAAADDSILCRLNLSKTKVLLDHLRFLIHVKENFEADVHLPLYAPPFGVASCSNKTVLEANVWDLPKEEFIGSLTVSAEGEFTVMAYMLHLVVFRDTQEDATNRLAREIIERFIGLKPLDDKVD